jgi:hypothetical protein
MPDVVCVATAVVVVVMRVARGPGRRTVARHHTRAIGYRLRELTVSVHLRAVTITARGVASVTREVDRRAQVGVAGELIWKVSIQPFGLE